SLYHRKDNQRLKQIESWLNKRQIQLKNTEREIKDLNNQIEGLDALLSNYRQRIDRGETYLIDFYNAKVDEYNNLLEKYNSEVNNYKAAIDEYNSKVEEINKLSKKVGTRYYIIPIPLPLGREIK
ncbi:hypothetical protein J7K44_01985, partial [bacterium]|nr:hypothetical protein [bacterium]